MTLPDHLQERIDRLNYHHSAAPDEAGIGYLEAGHGDVLLLLHGIGSGAYSWLYQLEELAQYYRVIAWDAPGYGESALLNERQPQAADYAAVLGAFCMALKLERVHLVGQSLGAIIAASFSCRYPHSVTSLTLLNPARGYGRESPQQRDEKLRERLEPLNRLGIAGVAEQRAPRQLSEQPPADALALVRWNMQRLNPAGYRQAAYLLSHAYLPDDAGYSGPVQVLSGSADRIVSQPQARAVAAVYPQAQFHSLTGLGHAAYAEGPQQVNERLQAFISALKSG